MSPSRTTHARQTSHAPHPQTAQTELATPVSAPTGDPPRRAAPKPPRPPRPQRPQRSQKGKSDLRLPGVPGAGIGASHDEAPTETEAADLAGLTDLTDLTGSDEDLRKADAAAQVRLIRQRLGLDEPPTPTTVHLPLARLVVIDEPDLRHQGKGFSVSLELVGMLHPPTVVTIPGTDTYRVVFGRRRVLGARAMATPPETIECHLYEELSGTRRALMILHENGRRAPAWVTESSALAELVDAHVGLTEVEIATALAIPLSTARQRLRIALLPLAIRDQVLQGGIPLTVVRRMLRLNAAARTALEEQVDAGEIITADLVNQALRGQIGSGLGVVRQALADTWQPWEAATTWGEAQAAQAQQAQQAQAAYGRQHQPQASSDEERSSRVGTPSATLPLPMGRPPARQMGTAGSSGTAEAAITEHMGQNLLSDADNDDTADPWDPGTVEQFLLALHRLSQRLEMIPGTARAGMLAQALSQELVILQRTRVHVHDAQTSSSITASAVQSEE